MHFIILCIFYVFYICFCLFVCVLCLSACFIAYLICFHLGKPPHFCLVNNTFLFDWKPPLFRDRRLSVVVYCTVVDKSKLVTPEWNGFAVLQPVCFALFAIVFMLTALLGCLSRCSARYWLCSI
ncbi:hypothetical protein EDB83DRAFT_1279707 [Lactarius deliciosus]|nr:hypothetical protein EDB83DRAFT_1279707 [Lactarius deliciosus]